ncbi:MAG: sensor histidine kinase [Solirubrobacteraceae bacterium]
MGGASRSLMRPRTTVRWRLTLLYGALFLVSGAAMLAITYTLVDNSPFGGPQLSFIAGPGLALGDVPVSGAGRSSGSTAHGGSAPAQRTTVGVVHRAGTLSTTQCAAAQKSCLASQAGPKLFAKLPLNVQRVLSSRPGQVAARAIGSAQRSSDLSQLVEESAIALGIMVLLSTALGWIVAGRVLAPLRTITATTHEISAASLDRRLALEGPRDELRQLADTIDGLLGRLEGAFTAQRRFVADASHELRTPLTATRALLELVLTDPQTSSRAFRDACEQVLDESTHQEQLIDALLALAQGQRGLDRHESVKLAAVVSEASRALARDAAAGEIQIELSAIPALAVVEGDGRLLERLAGNLIGNGVRHNLPGGWVRIELADVQGAATLRVSNSGPVVPEGELHRLLQPFQRLAADRTAHGDGLGLGLAIVAAIAEAHAAVLTLTPRDGGGLDVEVRFPAVDDRPAGAA